MARAPVESRRLQVRILRFTDVSRTGPRERALIRPPSRPCARKGRDEVPGSVVGLRGGSTEGVLRRVARAGTDRPERRVPAHERPKGLASGTPAQRAGRAEPLARPTPDVRWVRDPPPRAVVVREEVSSSWSFVVSRSGRTSGVSCSGTGSSRTCMGPGVAWLFDPLRKLQVEIVDVRSPWLVHADLDLIVRSGALRREVARRGPEDPRAGDRLGGRPPRGGAEAGRSTRCGRSFRDVQGRDRRRARGALRAEQLAAILDAARHGSAPRAVTVEAGHAGLLFRNGRHEATLGPGAYALWKGVARARRSSSSSCASRSPTWRARRS